MSKNMFTEIDKLPFGKEPNIKTKPTVEQVLKEFEELGYEWEEPNKNQIKIGNGILGILINKSAKDILIYDDFSYGRSQYIQFHIYQLLTKLFKALGWFDE